MKTSEIIRHIYSKTLAMDREVQARIMTAALDYIANGAMRVEGNTEIFMIECFMPMLEEARRNDETLSEKRSAAGKRGAEKRWKNQKSDGKTFAMPSRACAINEPQYMGNNLDINNNFLNINKPESDSKLISSENNLDSDNNLDRDKLKSLEDNLENSAQVIEHKQENKVINKKDNPTHAYAREEKAALRVESPENAATVRKPETMEDKRAKCGMRKQKFKDELEAYAQSYPADMLRDFFDYWTEMNKSRTMMRFEQQKTWETRLRLATWARRDEARGKPRKRGSTIMEAVSAVARSIEDDKKNGKRIDFNKLLNG